MKKNWFYLFLSMTIAAMPLTSCDSDDDDAPKAQEDKHDPESDADQVAVTGYDALDWLQNCIVVVDENNEVLRRMYGKPLDDSQPTVVSVPVTDYADAEEIFLGWVAPGKEATKVDGGYNYNLTDANGAAQGSVSFQAVEGEPGVIARMNLGEGTALKQVTEVKFVDAELWPENAKTPIYEKGKTYFLSTRVVTWKVPQYGPGGYVSHREYEPKEYYCVQGNNNSQEAILVWIAPDEKGYSVTPDYWVKYMDFSHLPTVPEAKKFLKFFNNYPEQWEQILDYMKERGQNWRPQFSFLGNSTNTAEFILHGLNQEAQTIKCLDLDKKGAGEIVDVDLHSFWEFRYRYMYIHIVPRNKW